MKFVGLVITAMMISFGAAAQTTGDAAEKRTVAKVQQKKKSGKANPGSTAKAAENADAVTLKDEKAHKAKWTFEEMLKRRLEIDAEDGEKQKKKE